MSTMTRFLSDKESALLRIIAAVSGPGEYPASGPYLVAELARCGIETSESGAHRTAASLVRKDLAWRAGTPKLQWYKVTETGRRALRGDVAGAWKAREGG